MDDNQTVLVADYFNRRIVEWTLNAKTGRLVAGGNGDGNRTDQLTGPSAVIVDKGTDALIICDRARVMRWPRRGGSNGTVVIENITCSGLATDKDGSLYIVDNVKHEVRRYRKGETSGTVVAGGHGRGKGDNQLNWPDSVFVDHDLSVYVSEAGSHCVTKWKKGARTGVIVAGGHGPGGNLTQLFNPRGVLVNAAGTLYVADSMNHRVMRWCRKAETGSVAVGGKGSGKQLNRLTDPCALALDRYGNLYVTDVSNHRVQKFSIISP